MSTTRTIRLLIAYDGTDFCGWQRQNHDPSIQQEIEKCLSTMTREDIFLHGAGRTDAGVHAEGMVAHFKTEAGISTHDFLRGLNSMLPTSIRIYDIDESEDSFHARFSARGKRYHYLLHTGKIQPPHLRLYSLHVTAKIDWFKVKQCLRLLQGEHDFSSFENSGSRDKNKVGGRGAVRTIFTARVLSPHDERMIFEFEGDGFLKNMVRNLVGTLLEVGKGKTSVEDFENIIIQQNREAGGPTAPAHALFLKEVFY